MCTEKLINILFHHRLYLISSPTGCRVLIVLLDCLEKYLEAAATSAEGQFFEVGYGLLAFLSVL